jgi:NTP pyrophosphatase (non-canonical NTP hydrolase)
VYNERIVSEIRDANLDRSPDCIRRRLLKILEELGEGCEAYLSRTGTANYKNKTWDDYREEGADTLIVMVDVALTEFEESKWPAATLLSLHIHEGCIEAVKSFDEMEEIKFEIARAVCSADHFLRQGQHSGFYGAVSRGVKAAARLCFARVPSDDEDAPRTTDEIQTRVMEVIGRKLDKWRAGRSTATVRVFDVPPPPKLVKPNVETLPDDVDLKSYMEKFD